MHGPRGLVLSREASVLFGSAQVDQDRRKRRTESFGKAPLRCRELVLSEGNLPRASEHESTDDGQVGCSRRQRTRTSLAAVYPRT